MWHPYAHFLVIIARLLAATSLQAKPLQSIVLSSQQQHTCRVCVCNKRVKPISNEKHFWGSAKSSFVMVTLDRFRSKFIKSLIVSGWLFFGFIRSQNVCVSLSDLHGFACNSVLFVCLCLCHDGNHFEQRLTTSNNQLFTLRRRYL